MTSCSCNECKEAQETVAVWIMVLAVAIAVLSLSATPTASRVATDNTAEAKCADR